MALCVAEVVVVVVDGTVTTVVGGGVVVLLEGTDVVPGAGIVVVLGAAGELALPWPVRDAAGTDEVGELPVVETPGKEPSVREADFVWKASTPARPATVAPMTIGARFIGFAVYASVFVPSVAQNAKDSSCIRSRSTPRFSAASTMLSLKPPGPQT